MRSLVAAAAALLLAPALQAAPLTPLEADLEALVARLEGEFDNHAQIAAQRVDRVDASLPWLHLRYRPVDAPELGSRVMLVTQARGGGSGEVYRRLLASFEPNEAVGAVVMRPWRLPDTLAAVLDLGRVTPDQLESLSGCEVYWRREGGAFVGGSRPGACRARLEEPAIEVVLNDLARLEDEELLLTEWAADGEGRVVYGNPDAGPLRLQRCRTFSGWMAWRDEGSGDEEWVVRTGLEVHDQGARVVVLDREGVPTDLELELAQVVAPGGSSPALRLGLFRQDGAERRPEALAWVDPASGQLGLSLDWLQAGFTRAPDRDLPSADLRLLVSWITGSFSSAARAAGDRGLGDVRLHVTPIWSWRSDARWLYAEQAAATSPDEPYRQRVIRLAEVADGLFESRAYELPDPRAAIGAWSDPSRLDTLNPAMLVEGLGCEILMRRRGDAFLGSTLGSLCESTAGGASWATSEVTITRDWLTLWARGWAADGGQVWGAVDAGSRFDRLPD